MQPSTPRWLIVTRDLSLLAVGLFGILHQELSGQASPLLLAVYTTLLGVPGAANAVAILKSTGGGGSPPSPPAQQESQREQP